MAITVSAKWTIIPILWLTPTYRVIISAVRVNRPRGAEDQVLIWSAVEPALPEARDAREASYAPMEGLLYYARVQKLRSLPV